jgi:ribosomal protein S18 acetylase RimI-like enzyme
VLELRRIFLLDGSRIEDRLSVCFGHLAEWRTKKVVEDVRTWSLQRLNDVKQFCYVAYEEEEPAGFIEFLPMKTIQKYGLNPCRISPLAGKEAEYKGHKLVELPYPAPVFNHDAFIACLWVRLSFTRRGIGKALIEKLSYDLKRRGVLPNFEIRGLQVYVEKRGRNWHPSIDWPAGSLSFYEKRGFSKLRDVKTSKMIGWVMRRIIR